MINNAIALYSVDAEQAVLGCLMLNTDHAEPMRYLRY